MHRNKISLESQSSDRINKEWLKRSSTLFADMLFEIVSRASSGDVGGNESIASFKKLLGPIRKSKITSDNLNGTLFQFIKEKCYESICEAILSEYDIYRAYLINTHFLSEHLKIVININNKLQSEDSRANLYYATIFVAEHAAAANGISKKGFQNYKNWLKFNSKKLNSLKNLSSSKRIDFDDVNLTREMKEELKTIFNHSIQSYLRKYDWSKIYDKSSLYINRVEDQIIIYLGNVVVTIINQLLKVDSVNEIIEILDSLRISCSESASSYEMKIGENTSSLIDHNTQTFQLFANNWFTEHPQIFENYDNLTINTLKKNITDNWDLAPWYIDDVKIDQLYVKITQIPNANLRNTFFTELENHYPSAPMLKVIKSQSAKEISELLKSRLAFDENIFSNAIPNPLSWNQLYTCLTYLNCVTELQIHLKKLLISFVNKEKRNRESRINPNERRAIEYLISCLFHAKQVQHDESILFERNAVSNSLLGDNPTKIGIDLVIKHYRSLRNLSKLIKTLSEISKDAHDGKILYLKPLDIQPISFIKVIENKEKSSAELNSEESFQLFWKYYNSYADEDNNDPPEVRINNLIRSMYYLMKSAISGNKNAQSRLLSKSGTVLAYDLLPAVYEELYLRLVNIPPQSSIYNISKDVLFSVISKRIDYKIYPNFNARLDEINNAIHLLGANESVSVKDKHCMRTILQELLGYRPLINALKESPSEISLLGANESVSAKDKHCIHTILHELLVYHPQINALRASPSEIPRQNSYCFRLMSTTKFASVINAIQQTRKINKVNFKSLLQKFDAYVSAKFVKIYIKKQNNKYHIKTQADTLFSQPRKLVAYLDIDTGIEIGRFQVNQELLKFNAYGDNVVINIKGVMNVSSLIFENTGANIDLNVDIESNQLYLASKTNVFSFQGKIHSKNAILIESTGSIDISAVTKMQTNSLNIKAKDLTILPSKHDIQDENRTVLHANETLQIELKNSLEMGVGTVLYAGSQAQISANSFTEISGQIISKGAMSITLNTAAYLRSNAVIQAEKFLAIRAQSILATGNSIVGSKAFTKIQIEKTLNIDGDSTWKAVKCELVADKIINNSPNLLFDEALIHVRDKLVNNSMGKIETNQTLRITGESAWNAGILKYGQLNVTLNKLFVHGMSAPLEIYQTSRLAPDNYLGRPSIEGGNTIIISGIYFNFFGIVKAERFILSTIVEMNIAGLTVSSSHNKSRLVALDLGVDLLNFHSIAKNILMFIDACVDGDIDAVIDMIFDTNNIFQVTTFIRWLLRTFTSAGKPVDLIWSILSLIINSPDILDSAIELFNQKEDIQTHQIVSMMTSINNLAIQGLFLRDEINDISDGMESLAFHSVPLSGFFAIDALALALPYSSNNALLTLESGLHIDATIIDRSAISFSFYDTSIAINKTTMFHLANQYNQTILAANYALIGNTVNRSGVTITNQFYSNVINETESGHIITNNATMNARKLNLTSVSQLNANRLVVDSDDTSITGELKVDNVIIEADENVDIEGSITTDHMTVSAGGVVNSESKIELSNPGSNTLSVRAHNIAIGNTSRIHGSGASVEFKSDTDISLGGTLSAKNISLQAMNTIDQTATIQNESIAHFDEDKPLQSAMTVSANDFTLESGASIEASQSLVEIRALHNIQEMGVIKAESLIQEAGADINQSAVINSRVFNATAHDSYNLQGTIHSNEAHISADNTLHIGADVTVDQPVHENYSAAPALSLMAQHLNVDSDSVINARNSAIYMSADDLSIAGQVDAELFQVRSVNSVHLSGHITTSEANIVSNDTVQNDAEIHFQNAHAELDKIIVISSRDYQSTNSSSISGNGTVSLSARHGTIQNINTDNVSISFDSMNDVEDLILSQGIYRTIHANKMILVNTRGSLYSTRDWNISYGVAIRAYEINLSNNIHSAGSLSFTSTLGDIYIGTNRILADQYLQFNAHNTFVGERSIILAYELSINAGLNIVNNAGTWGAGNYFQLYSGRDIQNNCYQHDIAGQFDTLKAYEPGSFLGGAGIGHDGVGFYSQSGGIFYNNASTVMSQGSNVINANGGIVSVADYHNYVSYYRNYRNWLGRHSLTIDYSYQLQSAVIYSANGSNTLITSDGSIYSLSTDFVSANENNFSAKYDIRLLGMILENREYKDRGNLYGVFDKKTNQIDEVAVPTVIINPNNTNIISADGRVELLNTYIQNQGILTIKGTDVLISAPILNHSYTEDSRGLTLNFPALSMFNTQPVVQDYHALANANGAAEISASVWNTLLDSANLVNSVLAGISKGSVLQALFPASYILSAQIGYTHTSTTSRFQTVASNVGIYVGGLNITAVNTTAFSNAVPINVSGDAKIVTRLFSLSGARLNSSMVSNTQSIAVGMSLEGHPTLTASASSNNMSATTYLNQEFDVAGRTTITADDVVMTNANIRADELNLNANNLSIVSNLSTTSSASTSVSAGTNGSFSVQHSENNSAVINQVSGIEVSSSLNITVNNKLYLEGGEIISSADGSLSAGTIVTKTVNQHKSGSSVGLSGNLHDIDSILSKPEFQQGITTVSASVGGQNYNAKQVATINFANGTNLGSSVVIGDLNTSSANGLVVNENNQFNLTVKIPTNTTGLQQLKDNFNGAREKLFPLASHSVSSESMQIKNEMRKSIQSNEDSLGEHKQNYLGKDNDKNDTNKYASSSNVNRNTYNSKGDQSDKKSTQASASANYNNDEVYPDEKNQGSSVLNAPVITTFLQSSTKGLSSGSGTWKDGKYAQSAYSSSATMFSNKPLGSSSSYQANDEDEEYSRPYQSSLEKYVVPASASYSDIMTVTQNSVDDAKIDINDIYAASATGKVSTGFNSGYQRYLSEYNSSQNEYDISGFSVRTLGTQINPVSESYIDAMANSRIVNDILMYRENTIRHIEATGAGLIDAVTPVVNFAEDVVTMDFTNSNSQSYQDAYLRMNNTVNNLENLFSPAWRFTQDVAIMDFTSSDSVSFKNAYSRMKDRVTSFNDYMTPVVSFANDFTTMEYLNPESVDYQDAASRMNMRYSNFENGVSNLYDRFKNLNQYDLDYAVGYTITTIYTLGASRALIERTTETGVTIISRGLDRFGIFGNIDIIGVDLSIPDTSESLAIRKAYLDAKFGRSGDLNLDISKRGYKENLSDYNFSAAPDTKIFYSGPANNLKADVYAQLTNKVTINKLPGGIWLENQALYRRYGKEFADDIWATASCQYAATARGEVYAFTNGANLNRIFNKIELPILQSNPLVTDIIYLDHPYLDISSSSRLRMSY